MSQHTIARSANCELQIARASGSAKMHSAETSAPVRAHAVFEFVHAAGVILGTVRRHHRLPVAEQWRELVAKQTLEVQRRFLDRRRVQIMPEQTSTLPVNEAMCLTSRMCSALERCSSSQILSDKAR